MLNVAGQKAPSVTQVGLELWEQAPLSFWPVEHEVVHCSQLLLEVHG
jgi:hypothetical protein